MKDISQRLANLSPAKRALLEQQLQEKKLQKKQENSISRRKSYQDAPLSFSQQRMWLLDQFEPGNPAYNRPTNINLTGTLNVPVLEKSLNEIIRRHEIFCTSFEEVSGKPFQKINPNITLKLPIIDLSHLEDEKTEIEIQGLAIQEAQQTFDLTQAPLLKAKLVGLNEQEHILLLTMHHIVFDGWSVGVLIKELAAIYGAFLTAKTSPLPELSIQYADFAIWQKQQQQTEKLESQLSYWKKQLGGKLPVLELPADRPRAAVQTFRGAKHSLLLPNHLVTSLKAISLKENVTLFMTLLAGFKILIYRYTSEEDIIVGTPIAGRNRKETEKLIGLFINTLVLRNQLNSKQNFIELLAQVREVALGGYAHQDVPFEKLMEELQPERGLSYTPLFQVLFQLRNFPEETIEVKGLKFDNYHLETGLAMLDLALEIEERAEGLLCVFKYNTDLFDASTIERMAVHFQTLLEGIVDNPRQSISQLPLLNKTQQFSCVLIGQESFIIPCAEKLLQRGHVINGIVSTGQIIHDWAQKREIPCTSSNKNLGYFLKKISFDYLFSISNLKILTAEVLKLPTRGAINLHDALLPKYGGLYAPSWAIFNQESEHGLTWHWITPGIDEGDIIKQIKLPVNESENAFTLNMKCYDAALDSFAEIIDDLAFERIEAQPQNLEQSLYFNAVQRPTPGCIVNWNWTAKTIDALIRCLDFGNYKNPFGNPKLYVEEKFYHINQLEISKEVSDKPSGTIVKLNNDYLQISTASQDVIVRSLQTLEGKNLSWKDWAIEVNLQEGDRLNSLSAEDNQQIEEIEVNCLRSENFWVKQLSNWEPLELPIREKSQTLVFNLPRIQKQSFSASSNIHNFISETSLECSPQDFLLTAFVAYLARISQSKSFSIGIESSIVCSSESKLNQLFSSVVPCNLEINLEQTFTDFFVLVQQQINLAQKSKTFHRDIVTRYPQLANLQNLSIEQQLPITVQLTETLNNYHPKSINKFVLVIAQNGDCACFYDENSYSDITIDNLLQSFAIFIEQLLLHSNDKLTNLSLIPSKDWTDLEQVNNRYVEYQNNLLLHQLFEAQVELTPNAIALQDINNEQTLTYFELNQRANKLAHYLQSKGVQPDVLVGVCVERSVEMLISILAVLKAGGAYVPLDPNYPTERLTLMMSDARISVLLTQECWISKLPKQEEIFCLDRDWNIVDNLNHQNPVSQAKPEHLAYVIYTSGSTGNPKGVMVQHDSLVNFTQAAVTNYGIVECDHILQFASISFDAAAEEIYPCLICGGTLVLRTEEMLSSVNYFLKKCRDWQITVLDLPTAYWQQIAIELETGNITLPESLRLVIIGGERVSPEYVKIWQKHVGDYPQLINTYGPTEGTVVATAYTMTANSIIQHEVSIGKAIANVQTYVLDANLQPLPIGVAGELHIGGMGVARGYLNRQELTAEKFIPNPFSNQPNSRLYKTGDLVRYLSDGNIEFLGRIDNQVKIRGFRIELGEIESVLNSHPQINQAVVIASSDNNSDKRLIAYLVTKNEFITTKQLSEYTKKQLPEYMVPGAFVTLDSLPLTPNGKIDRRRLPLPDISQASETSFVAPKTETEEQLAKIWSQVLGIEKIGIYDNFFELGGHSLKATQVISRIQKTFFLELPLRHLFESPTVEKLAFVIEKNRQIAVQTSVITLRAAEAKLTLSFAQERLWFLNQLEGESATYNMTSAWMLMGNLSVTSIEQAFNEITHRHEILRTTFTTENGVPIQVIAAAKQIQITVEDLQTIPEKSQSPEIQQRVLEESKIPFNLATDTLIRIKILRLNSQRHVLILTMHHIVSDGWSFGVFWRELSTLYKAYNNGENSPLAQLPIQYADYALWQREWLQGNKVENQLKYWKQQLADAPPLLELPSDYPRPPVETFRGGRISFNISTQVTQELNNLSQKYGCTLFMTLLTAWSSLLYRYSGQSDILVGTPIANRNQREIEPLIGFFVNTLVLRTQFEENISFAELLKTVRQTAIEAYAHQDLPFEQLVKELQPQRSLSHNPLFQVMFALQNTDMGAIDFPELTSTKLEMESVVSKFDLFLSMNETSTGLKGEWEYNSDLFDEATINRWIEHFQVLLEGIIANPQKQVSQLPLLTQKEQHQLLVEWNNTATEYPSNKCIHQLFEQQVEQTPDAVAVTFNNQSLTYYQLNNRANQLANYLHSIGVNCEDKVGICVERSIEMVVGLLAILKAGGAYVPLDSSYPKERITYMLEDSGVSLLLTQTKLLTSLPENEAQIICLDTDSKVVTQQSNLNPNSAVSEENLAYVIYTSGSTGKPKGVAMKHFALANLIKWQLKNTTVSNRAKTLQFAPISFDVSFQEIFSTWCAGGTLVLIEDELRRNPVALLDLLAEKQVERLFLPFVALQQLAESAQAQELLSLNLREVITAGEQLQITPAIASFFSQLKDCTLHNHYGPSETHVVTSFTLTGSTKNWSALPPIGTPITNTQIYILDNHLQPVPIGIPGEIYIGGAGLARCYLNRPEITQQKFIPNPFSNKPNSRLYKTGDLARYLKDGNIEYISRIDNQVKIRGFRIELGEIEAKIAEHSNIQEVAVIAREIIPGDKRLVAYIVCSEENTNNITTKLRDFLKQKLPQYMIPNSFVILDALPLTPSGKVDRKALPAPDTSKPQTENFVAPRDSLEQQLVQIWEQVLGIQPIGVTNNFFELGGHSLLTVRLVAEIEKVTQKKLPLAALFQFTTISEIANVIANKEVVSNIKNYLSSELPALDEDDLRALLTFVAGRSKERIRPDSLMNPIRSQGEKPPLFYCANGINEVSTVAHYLDKNQPVYLLESGLAVFREKGKWTENDIKAIAARHVRDMLEIYPSGPYLLVGYSFGKNVAYEVAKQLQQRGKKIVLLAILDTSGSGWMYGYYVQKLQPALIGMKKQLFSGSLLNFARNFGSLFYSLKDDLTAYKSSQQVETNQGEYLTIGYSGKITLFVTAAVRRYAKIQRWLFPAMGWGEHAVDIIATPGDHYNMIEEPHARVLADKLSNCINKALEPQIDDNFNA